MRKYYQLVLERWKHVLSKKYLIFVPVAALLVAAFFILQSGNLLNQNANKETGTTAELTGKISGLPPESDGNSKTTVFEIIDPTSSLLAAGKIVEDPLSSYRIKVSPGWRMAIVKVWDFDSKKLYAGSSRIFNVSRGKNVKADIEVRQRETFGLFLKTAYAAEEQPIFAVAPNKLYSDYPSTFEIDMVRAGHRVVVIDELSLGMLEEERNLPALPSNTYGDYKPLMPNFLVKVDIKFKTFFPIVTTSVINVEDNKVIWSETIDSNVDTRAYGLNNVVNLASDSFIKNMTGKGPNPVKLPKFTPSTAESVKSPAEWGAKMRKLLGLDKQSKSTTVPQTSPSPTTTPACDFNGFVSCRDTFNLQGCIDACPLVNKSCPEGTPPDTECKETDENCSNKCWDQGNSHGSQCADVNNCSMQEIEKRLKAQ